ncbi:MAG: hypothetical protein E6649_05170 [Paeniclostridium sordellii]|nr:hypothetical protein [Paeniclostridium sordellii]
MKIKKLILATGEEFENIEILDLSMDEESLQIPVMKIKLEKKEVLINRDYILSLELQKLQTI